MAVLVLNGSDRSRRGTVQCCAGQGPAWHVGEEEGARCGRAQAEAEVPVEGRRKGEEKKEGKRKGRKGRRKERKENREKEKKNRKRKEKGI
jgi:hypothetical protein